MMGNCEICHKYDYLECHHVFAGTRRSKSERYGAKAYVCHACHMDIHAQPRKYVWLKANWQRRVCEEQGWTTDEFIEIFGKNYA